MVNYIKILYGIRTLYKDITQSVYNKCIGHNNIITIPKSDIERSILFGDHIPTVHKHILIHSSYGIMLCDDSSDIVFNISTFCNLGDPSNNLLKKLNAKRICVYTVIFGNYDRLQKHIEQTINCDFICFTDDKSKFTTSDINIIEYFPLDKIENNVIADINKNIVNTILFRTNLFIIEPLYNYDICVYIDGNVKIVNENFIYDHLMNNDIDRYKIMVPEHQDRICAYTEAEFCIKYMNKYDNTNLDLQISEYKLDGYPQNNGLYWNGCIFYTNPFNSIMKIYYDMYTDHMIRYVKDNNKKFHPQGQVSLPYVLWKIKDMIPSLILESLYTNNYYLNVVPHS